MSFIYEYPRFNNTVDIAIIVISHTPAILLIRRKNNPFSGCLSLPGGYVEQNERLRDAAARELKEETGLVISSDDLVFSHNADKIDRDPRGRTISAVYSYFALPGDKYNIDLMPKVTGQDDAMDARWFPVKYVLSNKLELAFDHFEIIKTVWENHV